MSYGPGNMVNVDLKKKWQKYQVVCENSITYVLVVGVFPDTATVQRGDRHCTY